MLGKTKATAVDEKLGTEELDKMLQSEMNKADDKRANLKKNTLSNFEENIDLVNQEIQNQPEELTEANLNMVFSNQEGPK